MSNKKILGATKIEYKEIEFKSKLELGCYKKLENSGLEFAYEPERIVIWNGLKLNNVKVFTPKKEGKGRYGKEITLNNRALLDITYTPDFKVVKGSYIIYFDVKGKENDTYPLKKKIFLKVLENRRDNYKYLFMEPHSIKQMVQAINIIQQL